MGNSINIDYEDFEGGATDDDGMVTPEQGTNRRANMRKYDSQYKLVLDTLS